MTPPHTGKLLNVQVLRFLAAALVVHAHAIDLSQRLGAPDRVSGFGPLENFGAFGVDLFFVISGFIIAHTAFRGAQPPAAQFAWRRVWRVVPVYFLMSLPWLWFAHEWGNLSGPMLVATFFFWPAAGDALTLPALLIGWTLMFEMLFYAGAAFALFARARWVMWLLPALFAAFWLLRVTTHAPAFQFLGNPIILEFLMGFAIAWIAPRLTRVEGMRALMLGGLGLLAGLAFGYGPIFDASATATGEAALARVLIWGVPAALIVLGAVATETRAAPTPAKRAAVFLGDASYAIYLAHPLAYFWIEKTFRQHAIALPGPAITLLGVGAAAAAGVAVYLWIERPLAKLRPLDLLRDIPGRLRLARSET